MTATRSLAMNAASSFIGKSVALVHPAWHSCGTYRSVLGQIAAYRAFGARVYPVAVSIDPGFLPGRRWIWRSYIQSTPELDVGERFFGGAPFRIFADPKFLRDVVWPYLHGDQAVIRAAIAEHSRLSPELEGLECDFVHCNHFFLMPVAERLGKGRAPIILDSHDLQARQFMLMNENMPWLSPRATYDSMLARELDLMRGADLLVHVNTEETRQFQEWLPEKAHALLYPAGPQAPTGPGGPDVIIVASYNSANIDSVIWFLREVAPLIGDIRVRIVGSVDQGVQARAPAEYERYKDWLVGRVDDLAAVYGNARLALLPTIGGFGLSIKTLEAMASGLPLVATSHALRGMGEDAATLEGVTIADDPIAFAQALREKASAPIPTEAERRASAVRAYYDTHFSYAVYERNLAALAAPLLEKPR